MEFIKHRIYLHILKQHECFCLASNNKKIQEVKI